MYYSESYYITNQELDKIAHGFWFYARYLLHCKKFYI